MFWLFARAARRGLSQRLAIGLGLVFAAAVLTKVTALGFAPGWAAGSRCCCGDVRRSSAGARRAPLRSRPRPARALRGRQCVRLASPADPRRRGRRDASPDGGAGRAGQRVRHLPLAVLPAEARRHDGLLRGALGPQGLLGPALGRQVRMVRLPVPAVGQPDRVRDLRRDRGRGGGRARAPRIRTLGLPLLVFALLAGGLVGAMARAGYPLRAGGTRSSSRPAICCPCSRSTPSPVALAVSLLRRHRLVAAALGLFLVGSQLHLLAAWELTIQRYYL